MIRFNAKIIAGRIAVLFPTSYSHAYFYFELKELYMIPLSPVHFVPIFVTSCIYLALGTLWYSPWLFGPTWLKEMQLTREQLRSPWLGSLAAFFMALLMSYALSQFIILTNSYTLAQGACLGLWIGLGFIVPTLFSNVIWEKKSLKIYLIHVSLVLLFLMISGSILSFWR
ncbi:hypothetical protein DB43_HK00080 [Parachlamydia acanthamoebae]|nr:hypothetical protein DB43_HK00080 [Parachlamydia acanthamoebae]